MQEIARYSGCFICGQDNLCGLKARFYYIDGKAVTECVAEMQFEGYRRVYHGGITAALLDEVMIKALLAQDIFAMTVEMTVRYHQMVETGQKLLFEGRLEKSKGRLYLTVGEARTSEGVLVASAEGKYLEVKENIKAKLLESLEY